jgi:hypothetical protein
VTILDDSPVLFLHGDLFHFGLMPCFLLFESPGQWPVTAITFRSVIVRQTMPLGAINCKSTPAQGLQSRDIHGFKLYKLEQPALLHPYPYFIQVMGNSHSGRSKKSSSKTHLFTRKPSILGFSVSRISLGCGGGGSSLHSSEPSIETSKLVSSEKFAHGDDIDTRKHCMLAYSPTLVDLDDDGEVAFQEFLREYPG